MCIRDRRYAIFYGVPKIIVKLDITENQNHLIWALVQKKFKNNKLSAGRVQTPVLGWIIERFGS